MALMRPNPLDVLATPTDVFLQLREKPQWLWTFLLITIVTLAVAYSTIPFAERISYLTLSQRMDAEQLNKASAFLHRAALLGLVAVPLALIFRWLVLGTIFYATSTLLGAEQLRFKVVYAVVVYSELVLLLMAIINILLLQIKGIDVVQHTTDLQAVIGLDFFLKDKSTNLPLFTVLNSINVFNLWYVVVLTIGISVVTSLDKLKSASIVTTVWLFGVCVQVALSLIAANSNAMMGK